MKPATLEYLKKRFFAYYNGDIDEAAFIQRLRDKMDSIRNDSTVTKYNFEG